MSPTRSRYPPPVPPTRRQQALVSLSFGTGLLAACGGELPVEERIITTRILAVRSEVIAPLIADPKPDLGLRCQALPFEGVRLTPFIVTPTGPLDLSGSGSSSGSTPDFDPVYIACNLGPGQGLFACLKSQLPTTLADIPECPVPSFMDLGMSPGSIATSLPESPSPCLLPSDGSDDGAQDFVVPFAQALLIGGDVEITMISQSPGSPSTADCAKVLLADAVDLPNDCLYSVQRVPIGPIEQLLVLAKMFGVKLPPELGQPPDPADIPDGDRNPRIVDFSVTLVHQGTSTELGPQPRGATIKAEIGDTLVISTSAPADDLQEFLVPINGGAGGTDTQTEAFDGAWFRTWGSLLSNSSDDIMSRNEWTMKIGQQDEDEVPPDGRAGLFYVLRDGRNGADWWWISVEVTLPIAP